MAAFASSSRPRGLSLFFPFEEPVQASKKGLWLCKVEQNGKAKTSTLHAFRPYMDSESCKYCTQSESIFQPLRACTYMWMEGSKQGGSMGLCLLYFTTFLLPLLLLLSHFQFHSCPVPYESVHLLRYGKLCYIKIVLLHRLWLLKCDNIFEKKYFK